MRGVYSLTRQRLRRCLTVTGGILLGVLMLGGSVVFATEEAMLDQKINFIQSKLDESSRHSKYWQNGWQSFFVVNAIGQGAASSNTSDEEDEYDLRVRTITSLAAATDMYLRPMQAHKYSKQLRELPSHSLEEKKQKLLHAESMLAKAAEREKFERSINKRIMPLLLNALAGAAIAFDDDRKSDGVTTFLIGTIASEIKIRTSPNSLGKAQSEYLNGEYLSSTLRSTKQKPHFMFEISTLDQYFKLSYHF